MKKIVIVSHVFVDGPSQALLRYLNSIAKTEEVIFIGHPLLPEPGERNTSSLQIFRKGKKIKEKFHENFAPRFGIHYLSNFFLTVAWIFSTKGKWDLFIGVNNLNTLSGIILRLLGKVNKVIYYVVDYTPKRFENPIVNNIYHYIDKLAVAFSSEIWNLSPRMDKARLKFWNLKVNPKKSKIVPMGIWTDEIKRAPLNKIEKFTLVFIGHLLKKQGVQLVLRAIPQIIKIIPKFRFLIIGIGEYEGELKRIVEELAIDKHVSFIKQVSDYSEREYLMSKCACAIALYQRGDFERNFTYYADPGKLKDYLGAGLPIIMTDVPHNAYKIQKSGCGLVIDYNEDEVAKAVIKLMNDSSKLETYRKNAIKLARNFDWSKIYNKVFAEFPKEI